MRKNDTKIRVVVEEALESKFESYVLQNRINFFNLKFFSFGKVIITIYIIAMMMITLTMTTTTVTRMEIT